MHPGDRLTVTIDKPVAGGRMLARHHGAVVLVAAAIPGEVLEVEIERVQRGTAWATATRLVEPSPDRIDSGSDPACGGMAYGHIRYERQLALKQDIVRDAFTRLGRLPLETPAAITPSPPEGYRMRARLHVQGSRIGFFREGTHELCDARSTRQLRADTLEVVEQISECIASIPLARVEEIELAENAAASERACHLTLSSGGDPSRLAHLAVIPGLTGASCSPRASARSLTVCGTPEVTDDLVFPREGGSTVRARLTRNVRAFFQGNRFLLSPLAARVSQLVPSGRAIDLYAGVGLFAVTLAARGDVVVTAVEGDRISAGDLKKNAAAVEGRLSVHHLPVEQVTSELADGQRSTVVLDPPRTGLSQRAIHVITGWRARRLVYVSCDVATLARDARVLVSAGYGLRELECFDLFPNTAHVETVAVFDR